MQPSTPHHEFSYGFKSSRSTRLAFLTLSGLFGVLAAGCLGGIVGMAIASLVEAGTGDGDRDLLAVPVILICLLAGGVLTWVVINIIAVAKMGAWLQGTRLTVRQRRSRTVDLARARSVSIRPSRLRWKATQAGVVTALSERVPEVVVSSERGVLRMRLCDGERAPLPKQDLQVLAVALSRVDVPGAADVSQRLQMLASGRASA